MNSIELNIRPFFANSFKEETETEIVFKGGIG